jgi:hypothetical protein
MPSPSATKSPPDSDQNLTIEWNLLSGSVRSEPNGRDPDRPNAPGWLGSFCSNMRFDLVCKPPLSRRATAFSASTFGVPSKPDWRRSPRPHDAASTSPRPRLKTCSALVWPRRCSSRMPAMRFGWPRRNHGALRCCQLLNSGFVSRCGQRFRRVARRWSTLSPDCLPFFA